MTWTQTKGFNQGIATKIKNLCLGNVQSGFGIPGKYPTAWEAWLHTQQHTDPIPIGVDVPVFFSYTANIDGVTQNYGHIGVRLANGTFWSDGNIYPSIEAYTANHLPKYVGWGESVNDVTVIKKGTEVNDEGAKDLWRLGLHREPENDQVWRGWVGKPFNEGSDAFRDSTEWLTQNHILKVAYPDAVKLLNQMKTDDVTQVAKIAELNKALADAKAAQGTGIDPTTTAQIAETNVIVKQILSIVQTISSKIAGVFK